MKSDRFATELTIRFPRVKAIRDPDDKVPRHATCLPELQMIVESSRGQLGRMLGRGSSDEGEGTGWRQGRRKKQYVCGVWGWWCLWGPCVDGPACGGVGRVRVAEHDVYV